MSKRESDEDVTPQTIGEIRENFEEKWEIDDKDPWKRDRILAKAREKTESSR